MSAQAQQWTGMLSGGFASFRSGVRQLHLFPISFGEVLDLVVRHARPFVVLTNVAYFTLEKDQKAARGLDHLARSRGVDRLAHRAHKHFDLLVIARDDLPRLLRDVYQYNLFCWDAARLPLPSALARQHELMTGANPVRWGKPALHLLDGAHLFVWSHDNDSLVAESRDQAFVRDAFSRALRSLAAAAGGHPDPRAWERVADVPTALADSFLSDLPAFELRGLAAPEESARVRIAFDDTATRATTGRPDFVPKGYLIYDPSARAWARRPA